VLTDDGSASLAEARKTHLAGVRERFLQRFDERELRELSDTWRRLLA
jgi:hypothetical protein